MLKTVKVLLVVTVVLFVIIPGAVMAVDLPDVKADTWGRREIQDMANLGFIAGFPDGNFYPDKAVTRAQFAAIIINSLKLPVDAVQQATFKDVHKDHWAFGFIEAAGKAGFINGYQGQFRPEDMISREEMTIIVMKMSKKYGYPGNGSIAILGQFRDSNQVSTWAAPDVGDAVKFGYLEEVSSRVLAPRDKGTRAQAAVAVHRVLKKVGLI